MKQKTKKVLSRALLATTVLAAGSSFFLHDYSSESNRETRAIQIEEITRANEILRNFPENLSGAIEVRKYETPGARYCLVHILDCHKKPSQSDQLRLTIQRTQEDIYSILSYLVDNHSVEEVYLEGISLPLEERFERGDLRNQLETSAESRKIMGPTGKLYLERKIKIKAGTTDLVQAIADTEVNNHTIGRGVLDNQEDVLLALIADDSLVTHSGNPLAVAIYGGLHAWGGADSFGESFSLKDRKSYKDNIAWWNRWHTNKFSLIEVIPSAYEDFNRITKKHTQLREKMTQLREEILKKMKKEQK